MMADTGVDCIEPLDPLGGVEVWDAKARVGGRVALMGGVHTVKLAIGTLDEVASDCRRCLDEAPPVAAISWHAVICCPRKHPRRRYGLWWIWLMNTLIDTRTFTKLSEGFVYRIPAESPDRVAVMSRCAILPDGEVLCSFNPHSSLGSNDRKPIISRSRDGGETWHVQGVIWPEFSAHESITGSISGHFHGDVCFYGTSRKITAARERSWCSERNALRGGELVWARSSDRGRTWDAPRVISRPVPGSPEAPGVMWVTRNGRWLCPYAPYNSFDPDVQVVGGGVVCMMSDDEGVTWDARTALSFDDRDSCAAESWVVQLADGRLLCTCWHVTYLKDRDYPNAYAISEDDGETSSPTRSTGILGQAAGLAPLPDGRVLFIYNQRKYGEVGVWLALAYPTSEEFGVQTNLPVWTASSPTQNNTSGEAAEWTDFSFGEPSIYPLTDGTMLATFWCVEPDRAGVRFVKLAIC